MSPLDVAEATRQALTTVLLIASPFLLGSLAVGLAVGLIQAGTRMNDMTLSLVPRIAIIVFLLFLTAPLVGKRMTDYFERAAAASVFGSE